MRVVQIAKAGAPLELVAREIPGVKAGEVRIRVQACGVCGGDVGIWEGAFPNTRFPIVPGHEVVGLVDAAGAGVSEWQRGQRVGVGWYGGHCGTCSACREGDLLLCENGMVTGISYDGGWADYMVAPAQALIAIPESFSSAAEAAPLLCAGITTYNALRHSGAEPGDLVAVLGIGGLGHLGVQFAAKMGFDTVAIARGADKAESARQLGARHYIDSSAQDVAKSLSQLGGAKAILATATSADAMSAAIAGLGRNGVLLVVGAPAEPIKVPASLLIMARRSIRGVASGTAADSEDTLKFSAMSGVHALIERYPLDQAVEAFKRMTSGNARFRVVLETGA